MKPVCSHLAVKFMQYNQLEASQWLTDTQLSLDRRVTDANHFIKYQKDSEQCEYYWQKEVL